MDSLAFNRHFEYTPAAIVFPRSTQDVAIVVKCASPVNGTIPVSARSGGHSYGAFNPGGQDGTLVIDLSNLKNITVNQDYTLNIQTGNRLGDVALALFANGNVQWPMLKLDLLAYVGIGGHAGCGGFGLASRAWGLVLDQIESTRVVIANSTVLRAPESINSDLFWALHGASRIATEYKVRTRSAPPSNIVFSYTYSVDPSVASEILASFQSFYQYSAPPELGLQLSVFFFRQLGIITLSFIEIYMGSLTAFNTIIAPLISSVAVSPRTSNVTQFEWIPSLVRKGGIGMLDTSLRLDAIDTFFAKSLMVPHDAVLAPSAIRALFDYLGAEGVTTDTKWFVLADLFDGEGSMIGDIPLSSTAYAQPLSDIQWQTQYYGDHYPILQSIHSKYNPSSPFRYPQAVAT
ncbi:FAD-binding domain-containing protein [Pleurotus eryngii]|uniref:FAD-binding domain-containing protein n=1 Tax=Pleurotus eryngii TaxID=5323 RepID=A0A9P6DB01_PLEER|nr:FAD-binding domain-containing protein [Pleurotus eryngii]